MLVEPTATGLAHEAIQLGATLETSQERWSTLPPLSVRNPLVRAKPGATVLLKGVPFAGGDDLIVLASQRYGKGRVLAFPVQDSWQWQMLAPVDDLTHERLWSQLLRWLVNAVPDQVELDVAVNRFGAGRGGRAAGGGARRGLHGPERRPGERHGDRSPRR